MDYSMIANMTERAASPGHFHFSERNTSYG